MTAAVSKYFKLLVKPQFFRLHFTLGKISPSNKYWGFLACCPPRPRVGSILMLKRKNVTGRSAKTTF